MASVVIGVVIAVVLAAFLLFSALASYVALPRVCTMKTGEEYEKELGFWRDYDKLPKEEFKVVCGDGYELHAVYIPAKAESNRFVVVSHGYTSCRYGSLKYMYMYRDLGFHCIIYDNRRHGENKRVPCTMGVKESRDLCAVIDAVYGRFGGDIRLGLQGESMGSGLEIMAQQYKPKVRFIVNDCGYAELMDVLEGKLKSQFHLPGWLAYGASLMCRVLYGYAFTKVNPVNCLAGCRVPICFMHGSEDDFITPHHSQRMYEAAEGYKEIHLFPGAAHAMSLHSDEERYRRIVRDFLVKVGELPQDADRAAVTGRDGAGKEIG